VIGFVVCCGLLVAGTLALLLPSAQAHWRPHRSVTAANLSIYRRQLADIERDRRDGLITDEEFSRDREELEERLLADLPVGPAEEGATELATDPGGLGPLLILALPLAALVLYLSLGTPLL
jgi:cytochrome c-type biogenesis protein CcmH